MRPITLKEIVSGFLKTAGYDGLYNDIAECGCDVTDLMPCREPGTHCEAGYYRKCSCGEGCDFHIGEKE